MGLFTRVTYWNVLNEFININKFNSHEAAEDCGGKNITLDIFKNAILGERKGHSLCSAFMQDINVMSSLTILSMFNTIKEILRAIFLFGWLMWKVASCSGIVNKPMWNMQKKPSTKFKWEQEWFIENLHRYTALKDGVGTFVRIVHDLYPKSVANLSWHIFVGSFFLCWFGVIIMLDGIFVSFTLYLIKLQRCGKFSFTLQIIFSHFGSYDGICKSRTPNMVFMEFPFDFRSELNIYTCV